MKNESFSGYSQRIAISKLSKSLCKGDYDSSCFWSAEMHLSSWLEQWWLAISLFCASNINVSNPKISKFLHQISVDLPGITGRSKCSSQEELRQTIALVVGVCNFSPKDIPYHVPKPFAISQADEVPMLRAICSTNLHPLVVKSALNNDSQFLTRLLSKLALSIDKDDFYGSLRIISICLFLEKHKQFKKLMKCSRRMWKGLDEKYWDYWTFFVWDILMAIASQYDDIDEIIGAWRSLYVSSCKYGKLQSRLPYLINCIGLLTHNIDINCSCMRNKDTIYKGCSCIDLMYGDIIKSAQNNRFAEIEK
jgi:hypothetical protein